MANAQDARNPQPSFSDAAPAYSEPYRAGALVKSEFPKPSFVDYVELPKYSVAGTEMVQHNFPKGTCNCGGPTGIATETDIIGTMGKPAQTLQRANGEEALYFSKLPYGRQMSSPPPVPMAG